MSEQVDRKPNRSPWRPAAYLLTGTLALGGCAEIGNTTENPESLVPATISASFIPEGVNIRFSPNVNFEHNDGSSNSCFTANKDISISPTDIDFAQGDANGPWVGLPLDTLPEAIQDACGHDKDNTVWIAQKLIVGSVSFNR